MANNKRFNFGPIALTTTLTTNILNPAAATGGVNGGSSAQYIVLNQIVIVNKTASPVTVTLYKGGTGGNVAGTEFLGTGTSVPANGSLTFNGLFRFDSTDFLVGGAGTTTALSIYGPVRSVWPDRI